MESETLYYATGGSSSEQREAYEYLWQYLYRIAYQMVIQIPGAEALAQDSAQLALIRVHEQRYRCENPRAFRAWSRRIVSNIVIDELRRRKRLVFDDENFEAMAANDKESWERSAEADVLAAVTEKKLRVLFEESPTSDRSKRVIIGRFFENQPDEELALRESALAQKAVRPSHVQVTRAKNIAKLKEWDRLQQYLDQ